jgi:hypothetical protein
VPPRGESIPAGGALRLVRPDRRFVARHGIALLLLLGERLALVGLAVVHVVLCTSLPLATLPQLLLLLLPV